jgi:UDP:flavonoid glycosyltransferase YjiC (YdhE family)
MAESPPLRLFLAAFGDPGHAFPMIALGSRLARRGHEVTLETWKRWEEHVEGERMRFVSAPEYPVFPTWERPLKPYEAVTRAASTTRRAIAAASPQAVIHDILTLAPALAAELEGIPVGTLIPHVYPVAAPGLPPYAFGARRPRTAVGRGLWSALAGPVEAGVRRGREELNETRAELGLPPVTRLYGGQSDQLCIVATFPQLEYPRRWPEHVHVVGPVMWEPRYHDVEPPPGDAPLVLVAPSTAQDREHRLLRAAVAGLAGEPLRLLAAWNRKPLPVPVKAAANTRLVEWISYSRTMPECALVICHAGHGTMVRALASGSPVLTVPAAGDMAENAARADWAGVGTRLPWRWLSPQTVRLAVRHALSDRGMTARAQDLAAWAAANDGTERAADLVEQLALQRLATPRRPAAPARTR